MDGIGKSILLLVEGETEEAYFEKLKQNPWLKGSLAGVTVERNEGFKAACDRADIMAKQGTQVWLITDNDKRNAFVLEEKGIPFFNHPAANFLPQTICDQLRAAYEPDKHNYFLSVHDYMRWLEQVIGSAAVVEYWDRIQFLTEKKREFEKYYHPSYDKEQDELKLAYSCIAFEFSLLLHFEQNQTPFLWVDKGKSETDDLVSYLQTLQPAYEKGYIGQDGHEKPCHAYNCLYSNFGKKLQTIEDEWQVLMRIFKAIQNASWLRAKMQPMLERQSGKWYEVNPYIVGMDDLLKELLNIKPLGEPIAYLGLTVQFDFDMETSTLTFKCSVDDNESFVVNDEHKDKFSIKNGAGESFSPHMQTCVFPNDGAPFFLQYDLSESTNTQFVLLFKDPRLRAKSSQLLFLLTN